MRAYCRACALAFNVGIGAGLTTKSYRCPVGGCELYVMPGRKWRFGGRITTPERANADAARARSRRLAMLDADDDNGITGGES